jgi:hypothetical protein
MARYPVPPPRPPWARPWQALGGGFAVVVVGLILSAFSGAAADLARFLLVLLGVSLAGAAVALRLRGGVTEQQDRQEAALLVAGAAFTALAGYWAFDADWDSGRMLLGALTAAGFAGALLVLMPSVGRRIMGSLLILFHFGGILTAITVAQPSPWLSQQLWGHVYRPYLQFLHLFNAYHFYSPNPGPTTLLWFRVDYQSGKNAQWVRLPSKSYSPLPLHYTRTLALGMSVEGSVPPLPPQLLEQPDSDLVALAVRSQDPRVLARVRVNRFLRRRREAAGLLDGVPTRADLLEYAEPSDPAKMLLSSYARHVALTTPNPDDPDDPVVSVMVYRVPHNIADPGMMAEKGAGVATDKTLYKPVYSGRFDREGHLLDGWEFNEEVLSRPQLSNEDWEPSFFFKRAVVKEGDPYLYWLLPIVPMGEAQAAALNKEASDLRRDALALAGPENAEKRAEKLRQADDIARSVKERVVDSCDYHSRLRRRKATD